MKLRNLAVFFILSASVLAAAAAEETQKQKITLESAFKTAIKNTGGESIKKSKITQILSEIDQIKGNYYPNVSLAGNYLNQDPSGSSREFTIDGQSYARINIAHSIYTGEKYPLQISILNNTKLMNKYDLILYYVNLYLDVSRSFYDVKIFEQDVKNIEITISLTRDRIAELQKLSKIGKSRKGEVLTAEAQLAVYESQLEEAKGQLIVAKERFSFVTGLDKSAELSDSEDFIPAPEELEYYLSSANKHPYINILETELTAKKDNIKLIKTDYLPEVIFTGNLYALRGSGSSSRDSRWDIGIGLILPIYEGGIIQARINEITEIIREKEFFLGEQKRRITTEIKQSYYKVTSIVSRIKILEKAVKATDQNYQEQIKDYRNSLVTNLDVIQALNIFQESKKALDKTKLQAMSAWAELKSAVADIPSKE